METLTKEENIDLFNMRANLILEIQDSIFEDNSYTSSQMDNSFLYDDVTNHSSSSQKLTEDDDKEEVEATDENNENNSEKESSERKSEYDNNENNSKVKSDNNQKNDPPKSKGSQETMVSYLKNCLIEKYTNKEDEKNLFNLFTFALKYQTTFLTTKPLNSFHLDTKPEVSTFYLFELLKCMKNEQLQLLGNYFEEHAFNNQKALSPQSDLHSFMKRLIEKINFPINLNDLLI